MRTLSLSLAIACLFGVLGAGYASAAPCATVGADAYKPWRSVAGGNSQFALVIANDYSDRGGKLGVPALSNPTHDAQDINNLLTDRGYQVVCLTGLRKNEIIRAVDAFSITWSTLENTGATPQGVIYFAGHGGELNGHAFVLPADFDENNPDGGLNRLYVDTILEFLPDSDSGPFRVMRVPIVIIDACRTKERLGGGIFGYPNLSKILPPFKNAPQTNPGIGGTGAVNLIYSTSLNRPAGDGPDEPNGHGVFAAAFEARLSLKPWNEFVDPVLIPFVNDLRKYLVDNHIDQIPGGPFSNGTAASSYLWSANDPNSPSYYAWWLGKFKGEAEDAPLPGSICSSLVGWLDRLKRASSAAAPPDWVGAARDAYHKFAVEQTCIPPDPVAVSAPGAAGVTSPAANIATPAAIAAPPAANAAPAAAPGTAAPVAPAGQPVGPRMSSLFPAPLATAEMLPVRVRSVLRARRSGAWFARPFRLAGASSSGVSGGFMRVTFAAPVSLAPATMPPAALRRVARSMTRPSADILTAIRDRSADVAVTVGDGHDAVLVMPKGGIVPLVLSASQFSAQDFRIDCSAATCSKRRAFVTSAESGISGYVSADILMPRQTQMFFAHIDGLTGNVPPIELASLSDFLSRANDGGLAAGTVRISLVDASLAPTPAADTDVLGARDLAKDLKSFIAKVLSIDKERVFVVNEVVSDRGHAQSCNSRSIHGLCLTIEVVQTPARVP